MDYEERLSAHYAGSGAAFTRRYPPVELIELRRGDRFDEDSMTRRLMAEHGIEYVRGGAYSRVVLTPEDVATVQHEIWAAAGLCVNCGKPKHFAVNCMAPTAAQAAHAAAQAAHAALPMAVPMAVHTASSTQPEVIIEKCDRCGRYGHAATECHTKVENINCKNCHKRGHRTEACRSAPVESHKIIYTCFRCGYHGHTSNVCTSKFDLDGEKITIYNKYYPKTGYVPSDRLSWRKIDTKVTGEASLPGATTSNDSDTSSEDEDV
jgi:hypothetical protein